MEAESYSDDETAAFIDANFVPLEAHIKEHPAYFHRFDSVWTPSVIILDPNGKERFRIEGYLPKDEFRAHLELGLARVAFMSKDFADAERRFTEVLERYPQSKAAPEALYWKGVSRYKTTNDHTVLGELSEQFQENYPDSVWAEKTAAWAH
ncbi:MAG TPA: thioredoxin fold domain-containing protein [Pyrinomonadaceae bacterium]|nr:thioredoxin fold domain-containing protein [Pyrinomonadaceae bacterium]